MKQNSAVKIKTDLEKILAIVESAIQDNQLHAIDKDMALGYLRDAYESLLLLNFQPEKKENIDVLSAYLPEQEGSTREDIVQEEITVVAVEKEVIPTTIDELIDQSYIRRQHVDKDIIEALYGDSTLCKSNEEPEQEDTAEPDSVERTEESSSAIGTVLHETFNDSNGTAMDIASMLSAQAASQLHNRIGLNDRLMLMNDLFDNDPDLYNRTIDALELCESLDDAFIYLSEHFTMDTNKEGVKLLISILEAKFS